MNMSNYRYTIIIPHKNIPMLLQRMLDSIPQREDLQVIIVDDNSDPQAVDFRTFPGLIDPMQRSILQKRAEKLATLEM